MEPNLYVLRIVDVFLTHYQYTLMAYHQEFAQAVVFNRHNKHFPLIVIDGGDAIIPKKSQMTQQLLQNLNMMFNTNFEPLTLYLYSDASVRIGQGFVEDPRVKATFPKLLEISYTSDQDPQLAFSQLWQQVDLKNKEALDAQVRRQKMKNQPWVSISLMVLCVIFYSLSRLLAANYTTFTNALIFMGAMYQPLIEGAFELWRFITPAFLHGSIFHLLTNMYSLNLFGRILEPLYGRWKFLLALISSIVVGNVFVYFGSDTTVTVGMSGGLYGLMAMYLIYTIETQIIKIPQMRFQIFSLIGINLMINFFPNISWLSHLGGFITGLFFALLWTKKEPILSLRTHGLLAMAMLLVALGYFRLSHPTRFSLYPGTDQAVAELARKVNLDGYAQSLQEKMVRYYIKEGLLK